MSLCAEVLIESLPSSVGRDIFTYQVPETLTPRVKAGTEVSVPFGSQTRIGYIIDLYPDPGTEDLRPIAQITGQQRLEPEYLQWLKLISSYYLTPLSQVIGIAIPRRLSAQVRNIVKPLPDAVRFLNAVRRQFRKDQALQEFAAFLVSAAPQWKSKLSCQRQFGRQKAQYWLKTLQQRQLVEIYTEVQHQTEAKSQLVLTLLDEPMGLSERQQELLYLLGQSGGQMLLSDFCREHQTSPVTLRRLEKLGAIAIEEQRVMRRPQDEAYQAKALQVLTAAQQTVLDGLLKSLTATGQEPAAKKPPPPVLLHGVTGSGKTEIYLHALAQVVAAGQTGMFLVPEIALTPQMLRRCRAVFGEQVAVLHSELGAGEYLDEWERIRSGVARVVVGARSAIFAPLKNLKLIIMDEEHENSYKQDNALRYDARTLAWMRMHLTQGLVVYGSATPRIESFYRAQQGGFQLLSLPQRVHARPMPPVQIVDMRQEQARGNYGAFSIALKQALEQTLARQEQAILLLNRRGYASSWLCRSCGESVRCPLCAVSLTYHRFEEVLKCHYCDYRVTRLPAHCPTCQSDRIQGFGLGTQKLEETTEKLFPGVRILRMDRDTTTQKSAHTRLLDTFAAGEADVLIGTQMVAKGLDFPRVTLVGILAADLALNLPDFRAGERTFQLLTQAAGRAGRSELEGRIVLQTYAPEHAAIRHALHHDYEAFYNEELIEREQYHYPPFGGLIRLLFAHPSEGPLQLVAESFCQELLAQSDERLTILGPVPAPISRLQALYRVHALLKHPDIRELKPLLKMLLATYRGRIQRLHLDIDPYSML